MIEKRKIIQLTLISIGLVLILFTYFIYPTINKNKLFEAKTGKEKINLQEKIKKLERKEQAIINQMLKKKKYLSSDSIIRKQEKIKKLERKEQALINQIKEEKEYFSSGGVLKKGALEKLQTDLQKTSSLLAKKRSDLKKKQRITKDALEKLQTDLQKTSSSLTEKRSALEKEGKFSKIDEDKSNTFLNVEYKGIYNYDKPFTIISEKAYIGSDEPDIVYMTNMQVTLYINDKSTVVITSDKGSYNKITYDCFFEDNVKATDGKTIILSKNLDLLATEDSAVAYNNVYLTNDNGFLRADKVDYDFETKYYNISMFGNKRVKAKFIQ